MLLVVSRSSALVSIWFVAPHSLAFAMLMVNQLTDSEDECAVSPAKTIHPVKNKAAPASRLRKSKVLRCSDLPSLGVASFPHSSLQIPASTTALELCCGEAGLTAALNAAGVSAMGLDVKIHETHDIMNPGTEKIIADALRRGSVRFMHLGVPCNTHSPARYPKLRSRACPRGLPNLSGKDADVVAYSNKLTDKLFRLGRIALEHGAAISIENPRASSLWEYDELLSLQDDYASDVCDLHMCMFGQPYLKPTRILAFGVSLLSLNRRCSGGHEHIRLSGWRSFEGQQMMPTSSASAYPAALCLAWASDVRRHVTA